jgi:hypothetical protein
VFLTSYLASRPAALGSSLMKVAPGSAHRSFHVQISAALAADLDLLTQALDTAATDTADTITKMTASARSAVESYLGLSVAVNADGTQVHLAVLEDGTEADDIHTSLLIPLSPAIVAATAAVAAVSLILYAGTPGAFIDLAADLAWLTGRDPSEYRLDEHHTLPHDATATTPLRGQSTINQALGVLIGRGFKPADAERELYAQAATTGVDPEMAAAHILANLKPPEPEPRSA